MNHRQAQIAKLQASAEQFYACRCVVILLACFFIIGCSAPTQTYRPANYDGPAWQIGGKLKPGLIDDEIIIYIDGDIVAKGKLSDFKGSTEFVGQYKDYRINVNCIKVGELTGSKLRCIVYVDNERAATLEF